MEQYLVTASANTGRGLWTSICVAFAHVFGVESKNLLAKHNKVLTIAEERLCQKIKDLGTGFVLEDFRVIWESPLSVTVSALAVKDDANTCPKCGAKIDADTKYCGSCGERIR